MSNILLSSYKIGNLEIPNRVIMTTVKLGYADKEGHATSRHNAFYAKRAEGKVGLIITEPMYILKNGREIPTQLGIYDDSMIDGLSKMVDTVHKKGSLIAAHINHAGRAVNPKLVTEVDRVSASKVKCPANNVTPRALSIDEIKEYQDAFEEAAQRAVRAGFDAVEIPFSHGYLIHQFLSLHTNKRTDEYGGSFKNRIKFGLEIIKRIRKVLGKKPLIVRINAQDHFPDGMTFEDALLIAEYLEKVGVDALSITSGSMCESVPFCLYPIGTPKAALLPFADKIKKKVTLPVITAGRIRDPKTAKDAIEQGMTDFVGLGRAFLADPDWVIKVQNQEEEDILLCAACHQGCLQELRKMHGTSCLFNPLTGREYEVKVEKSNKISKVVVVGAGPGGLQAAITLAERGHQVTVLEQESETGGNLRWAVPIPTKEHFSDLLGFQRRRVEKLGVDLRLNTKADAQMIKSLNPDKVILATGAVPFHIEFEGLDKMNWSYAIDVISGQAQIDTKTAFIVGAGVVGLETAEILAEKGVKVVVIDMIKELGATLDPLVKAVFLKRLSKLPIEINTGYALERFEKDEKNGGKIAIAKSVDNGEIKTFLVENVILSMGLKSNNPLEKELENYNVSVIGDAIKPREALDAILEGFNLALKV